jgi:expansin (peptidoglycan-binding protein)
MKIKKLLAAVAIASTVTASAFAQTWTSTGSKSSGGVVLDKATAVVSSTAVNPVSLTTTFIGAGIYNKDFYLSAVGSLASTSATVTFYDETGSQMFSQSVNISNTPGAVVSYAAPVPFAAIKVSTTTTLSATNSISLTGIEVHR